MTPFEEVHDDNLFQKLKTLTAAEARARELAVFKTVVILVDHIQIARITMEKVKARIKF